MQYRSQRPIRNSWVYIPPTLGLLESYIAGCLPSDYLTVRTIDTKGRWVQIAPENIASYLSQLSRFDDVWGYQSMPLLCIYIILFIFTRVWQYSTHLSTRSLHVVLLTANMSHTHSHVKVDSACCLFLSSVRLIASITNGPGSKTSICPRYLNYWIGL